jgi:hypothetical protein
MDWALSSALPRTIDPIVVVRETLADAQANATGAFFFWTGLICFWRWRRGGNLGNIGQEFERGATT